MLMVKKSTKPTKKSAKTASTKTASHPKAKPVAKKTTVRRTSHAKVDYYPNRMTVAVSVAAVAILMLLAIIVQYNP